MRLLAPGPLDCRILRPKHSGFFATVLGTLLVFTANDAHVRDLELLIPCDGVASESPATTRLALRYFREVLNASVATSSRVRRGKPGRTRSAG